MRDAVVAALQTFCERFDIDYIDVEQADVDACEQAARAAHQAPPAAAPGAERRFPIMGGPSVPWDRIAPHERQARENHGQTLERLAERGGLDPAEALAVLEDRRWERMDPKAAHDTLAALVDSWRPASPGASRGETKAEAKRLAVEALGRVRATMLKAARKEPDRMERSHMIAAAHGVELATEFLDLALAPHADGGERK